MDWREISGRKLISIDSQESISQQNTYAFSGGEFIWTLTLKAFHCHLLMKMKYWLSYLRCQDSRLNILTFYRGNFYLLQPKFVK